MNSQDQRPMFLESENYRKINAAEKMWQRFCRDRQTSSEIPKLSLPMLLSITEFLELVYFVKDNKLDLLDCTSSTANLYVI